MNKNRRNKYCKEKILILILILKDGYKKIIDNFFKITKEKGYTEIFGCTKEEMLSDYTMKGIGHKDIGFYNKNTLESIILSFILKKNSSETERVEYKKGRMNIVRGLEKIIDKI